MFCVVFAFIYEKFSHGVHSPYMTYLFAWPLLLGALPNVIIHIFYNIQERRSYSIVCGDTPKKISAGTKLYYSGVSALTVSSLLRGIMDIAGTASVYQAYLMYAGWIMLAGGLACILVCRHKHL